MKFESSSSSLNPLQGLFQVSDPHCLKEQPRLFGGTAYLLSGGESDDEIYTALASCMRVHAAHTLVLDVRKLTGWCCLQLRVYQTDRGDVMNLLISLLGRKKINLFFQSVKLLSSKDPCRFAAEEIWIKYRRGLLAHQRIKGIFSIIAVGGFFFMWSSDIKVESFFILRCP